MIDKESWMQEIIMKLKQQFGNRLLFVGLQGSYQRNEATETSDLDNYHSIIKTMPDSECLC